MNTSNLTANQIVTTRKGWTREMVEEALSPCGHLPKKYHQAPLYANSDVKRYERTKRFRTLHQELLERAAREKNKREQEHAQLLAKREAAATRKQDKVAALPSPTPDTIMQIVNVLKTDTPFQIARSIKTILEARNPVATRTLYRRLEIINDAGALAGYLLRAQFASSRAKQYRGDSKGFSYSNKEKTLRIACQILSRQSTIRWGWGIDDYQEWCKDVLYVDLPTGQVSFHAPCKGDGPEYVGVWDGQQASLDNVLAFAGATFSLSLPPDDALFGG